VDGGVDTGNAATLVQAGATMLVAGASIFGTSDPAAATRALRDAAGSAA
jgi:pentose-5-phosphate-3-epimerase